MTDDEPVSHSKGTGEGTGEGRALRSRLRVPRIGRGATRSAEALPESVSDDASEGPSVRGRGREAVETWRRYRETQLSELAESNRLQREFVERTHSTDQATLPGLPPTASYADTPGAQEGSAEESGERRRDTLMTSSPFMFGFFGALGVLTAWWLAQNVTRLSSVITFVLIAVFLTLALNPIVESLTRRGLSRTAGVFSVFLGMVAVIALIAFLVVPPIVTETSTLAERMPDYLDDLGTQPWVSQLDSRYDISSRFDAEIEKRLADSNFISMVFGGVLGAAGWVAGGLIGAFTALVLTLYFLAALPTVKDAAYKVVPQSRRPRVIALAEEIMHRVGGYALGQVAVASINATCSWIMMTLLGVPYAAVLAVLVGLLGLIPLVGATLGAVIVALVALSQGLPIAVIVVIYYVIYQQIENYVIVPRIMSRTVSVPGALTVVAVLAGGTLMGVLGALIAIPVAAGLLLLYNEVVVPRQARL